jgi:hypothetical protein
MATFGSVAGQAERTELGREAADEPSLNERMARPVCKLDFG